MKYINIRLGWMGKAVANTLAYYVMATISAVESCIVQTPVASTKKLLQP
jgi:hypothetical protein